MEGGNGCCKEAILKDEGNTGLGTQGVQVQGCCEFTLISNKSCVCLDGNLRV